MSRDKLAPFTLASDMTVSARVAVVTPSGLTTVALPVATSHHAMFRRFRVIVWIGNAGAELNEENRRADRHDRPDFFTPIFHRNSGVISPVVLSFLESRRRDLIALVGKPLNQSFGTAFQPFLVLLDRKSVV